MLGRSSWAQSIALTTVAGLQVFLLNISLPPAGFFSESNTAFN